MIQMGHGSGGRLMHQLIREYFAPVFALDALGDAAVLAQRFSGKLAVTTDSYVVSPYFFPGGDIGKLSVCGTVNDLAMAGARPLYLTAGFILEEGFPIGDLSRILNSMQAAAAHTGIRIVAGDTKVVDKGKGDGIYINTAGIGVVRDGIDVSPVRVRPGDRVLLSGSVGNHGMAIMAHRNGISFEPELLSDVCALSGLVQAMLTRTEAVRCMRDPTRGGLATTLKEIALESGCGIIVREDAIPVRPSVRGACELLGLDPLYVANEGVLIAIVSPGEADALLDVMRMTDEGRDAAVIGEVSPDHQGNVLLKTAAGGIRIVEMLSGEQLPRIC